MSEIDPKALVLRHEADHCWILPQVGGSLGGWAVQGQHMLRAASAASIAAHDPYGTAGFPLVPFSNRIADARFLWEGRPIALRRNFPPEPHAIHGVGFQRPWCVQSRTSGSATLSLVHVPDDRWPWRFEARQHIAIRERQLTLELCVRNLENRPLPLAFGHHPYFPRAGASLRFDAEGVWLPNAALLPRERIAVSGRFDLASPVPVEQLELDHCYVGWRGPARIAWQNRPLALELTASSTLCAAVVYVHRGLDAFCFEPVPHLNNSLNLMDQEPAIPIIAPGAAFEAEIRLHAVSGQAF